MDEVTAEALQRAAERVREMHKRATVSGKNSQMPPAPDFVRVNNASAQRSQSSVPARPEHKKETAPRKSGAGKLLQMLNFKGLEIDGDISLLLGILLLLSGENDDELLMLALVYIML